VAAADVGNQLSQGEQNATLSDYREIRAKEKVKFPKDVMDASITLCRFAVLRQVLFQGTGPTYPLVDAMWTTALGLQNLSPSITAQYQALSLVAGIAPTYYARVIRTIQLGVHDYFQQVAIKVADSVVGVEVPNFGSMLQELKRGTFHQSTNWIAIPDEYMGSSTPRTVSTVGSTSRGTTPGASASVAGASMGTSVSSLTQDTPRESVTRVANTVTDNEFSSLTLRSGGTRAILRTHRPPSNDAGHEMCVAWWTRGGCYPNCGRRNTHQPFASAEERTRLLAYVRQHLVEQA
jgi:hypothetical protein